MKKITLWLFALLTSWQINAQFGCSSAVVIADGYTASNITTPGNGGVEDWNDNPTGTSINANYWDDDVYLFQYTAGATDEFISMTINSVNSWNGIGIFTTCTGNTFSGELDAEGTTGANSTKTVSSVVTAGQTVYIAVGQWGTPNGLNFSVTNFSVISTTSAPDCTSIISPADGANNVSSGLITWSPVVGLVTGYKLNVGTSAGATDVLNGADVGNVTSYNIGTLTGSTTYYVTIIPYNANGDATGCTETSFSSCNINIAPWSYDVEAAAATTNASIADCWSTIPVGPTTAAYRWDVDAAGGTPTGPNTGPSGANSGVKYFYTEASSGATGAVAELYTPLVDLSGLTDPSLQFFYHMHGANMGELRVDVFDGTTWTNDVFVLTGVQQTANTQPWREAIVSLNAYIGNTVQVRFRSIRGNGINSDMALDDITFDEAPACFDPINLGAANITATTVDVLFTDGSAGNQFDFAYVVQPQGTGAPATYPAGTPEDGSNQINATDFSIPVSGLTPATAYEIYVAADCNGNWVGPINFTTACESYNTFPFTETFEVASSSRTCWSNIQEAGAANWTYATGSSGGLVTTAFEGTLNARFVSTSGSNSPITKLVSPVFDMSALTNPRLKFHYAQEVWFGDQNELKVYYRISSTDPWVEIAHYTANVTAWTEVILTLPNPSATYQIAFEGINNFGRANVVDNVIVEETPSTPPACATNVVGTPDVSCGNFNNVLTWDAVSGADGYSLTIGTTPGGNEILDNQDLGNAVLYNFTGSVNTTYYFTVVPYNANGPATGCAEVSFTTNANGCYCVSNPTSNDGNGISNVQIATTDFSNGDVMYFDHTATPVDLAQGINANVQVSFATGYAYHTNIWIDFNDDYNFDASELVYQGESLDTNPTTLNASFIMPVGAPLGNHRMRIGTAYSGQATPNPCYSGSWGVTLDFMVNVVGATCTPPVVASTNIVPDCSNGQFNIAVDVTSLGGGTPVLTDGTNNWAVTTTGVVVVGPFTESTSVSIVLLHGSDTTCDLPLGNFTYVCPAVNDNLCDAISLTVNAVSTGTQYNNIGATAEPNEPIAGCFSDGINGSVWFSFVAPASGEVIITTDIAGASATDTEIALYDATGVTCSDLSTLGAPIACDQDGGTTIDFNSIITQAGLTPGNTYYIQVDDYGWGTTQGSFGIEVQEVLSSDLFDNNNFTAYPNPVKDILNLSYTSEITSVRVINMLGQEVIARSLNATNAQVDMSQLSAGTYIVNVTIGDTVKTIKVVKQ